MAIKLFQFTFHVNSFIVNSGKLTHQNMKHSTKDPFIPANFKQASEIFAWGPLGCLAASLKQYNKDRNAGIVNQRRKFPLVLKEVFSAWKGIILSIAETFSGLLYMILAFLNVFISFSAFVKCI